MTKRLLSLLALAACAFSFSSVYANVLTVNFINDSGLAGWAMLFSYKPGGPIDILKVSPNVLFKDKKTDTIVYNDGGNTIQVLPGFRHPSGGEGPCFDGAGNYIILNSNKPSATITFNPGPSSSCTCTGDACATAALTHTNEVIH